MAVVLKNPNKRDNLLPSPNDVVIRVHDIIGRKAKRIRIYEPEEENASGSNADVSGLAAEFDALFLDMPERVGVPKSEDEIPILFAETRLYDPSNKDKREIALKYCQEVLELSEAEEGLVRLLYYSDASIGRKHSGAFSVSQRGIRGTPQDWITNSSFMGEVVGVGRAELMGIVEAANMAVLRLRLMAASQTFQSCEVYIFSDSEEALSYIIDKPFSATRPQRAALYPLYDYLARLSHELVKLRGRLIISWMPGHKHTIEGHVAADIASRKSQTDGAMNLVLKRKGGTGLDATTESPIPHSSVWPVLYQRSLDIWSLFSKKRGGPKFLKTLQQLNTGTTTEVEKAREPRAPKEPNKQKKRKARDESTDNPESSEPNHHAVLRPMTRSMTWATAAGTSTSGPVISATDETHPEGTKRVVPGSISVLPGPMMGPYQVGTSQQEVSKTEQPQAAAPREAYRGASTTALAAQKAKRRRRTAEVRQAAAVENSSIHSNQENIGTAVRQEAMKMTKRERKKLNAENKIREMLGELPLTAATIVPTPPAINVNVNTAKAKLHTTKVTTLRIVNTGNNTLEAKRTAPANTESGGAIPSKKGNSAQDGKTTLSQVTSMKNRTKRRFQYYPRIIGEIPSLESYWPCPTGQHLDFGRVKTNTVLTRAVYPVIDTVADGLGYRSLVNWVEGLDSRLKNLALAAR